MTKAIVLGAGMVGRVIAADLAEDSAFTVMIADLNEDNLARAVQHSGDHADNEVKTTRADLSDADTVKRMVEPFDIVLGALSSTIGLNALRAVIEAVRLAEGLTGQVDATAAFFRQPDDPLPDRRQRCLNDPSIDAGHHPVALRGLDELPRCPAGRVAGPW